LALVIGLIALHQQPGLVPVAGIAFVIAAGIGAERGGGRTAHPAASAEPATGEGPATALGPAIAEQAGML
jgi:inner membrane transporter RhtA